MPYKSPWDTINIPKSNILSYLFPPGTTPSEKPVWFSAADPSRRLSPAEMLAWTRRFAVGLDKLGVAEQQTVFVFSPNHIFVPMAYLASAGSKRYFTGANPAYTSSEVAFQMKASQAAIALVHPSLLDTGIAAAKEAQLPTSRLFIFSDTECAATRGVQDWRSMVATEKDGQSWQWDRLEGDLALETTAVINFSSGTTGLPKGVCITHRNLIANTEQAMFNDAVGVDLAARPPERSLGFLPLYHAYAQLFTINIACKLEQPVYLMEKFVFDDFLTYIERFKITTLRAAPPILVLLAKRPEVAKFDISTVKYIGSGAAPLSSDLQNEVMDRFSTIVAQGWGMTETTCAGIMTPGMTKDSSGSVGKLLPNTEARLVDDDGEEVEKEGKPGELWIRGPQIMPRYWKNESATRESISDGWFKTGDVAITKNGKWWIVDRKKELIKVNGLQVAPAELEAVLLEHADVADAAVVGVRIRDEEFPRAYVVLRSGVERSEAASSEHIQRFVAGKVAKHKRLTGGVSFVNEVPKLASGKIIRKVLKEWAKRDTRVVEIDMKAKL